MSKKTKAIEERIEKRKYRIKDYQEKIKKEREGLKKDEQNLIHAKYNDVLQKMLENDIDSEVIEQAIDKELEQNKTVSYEENKEDIKNNNY